MEIKREKAVSEKAHKLEKSDLTLETSFVPLYLAVFSQCTARRAAGTTTTTTFIKGAGAALDWTREVYKFGFACGFCG